MKLLLDENLPVRLKYRFNKRVEVGTVSEKGWNAIKNGELLQLMNSHDIDILVTADRNLLGARVASYGLPVASRKFHEILKAFAGISNRNSSAFAAHSLKGSLPGSKSWYSSIILWLSFFTDRKSN
jgi:predicted nuclease of predicted toxin-antitoxin system